MARNKKNYYKKRSTSNDEIRRLDESRNRASNKIDQLAFLPLEEKKALIRQLLIEIGTDVEKNDRDHTGDGDQTTISTLEKRDVARHLFATGGDILEHFTNRKASKFAMACASGNLKLAQSELQIVKSKAVQPFSECEEMTKMIETRETSMRLSPLLLIVSLGKNFMSEAAQFESVAKLLLTNGASPVAKDVVGKTVSHYGAGAFATKMTRSVTDMCIRAAQSHHLYGKKVILHGLKREDMNGKEGFVGGFDPDSNRRGIYLTEDRKEVWIKTENISLPNRAAECQPYPLLTDIQDRLGTVSLHELLMPSEVMKDSVAETAEFLLKRHDTCIYTEEADGCTPVQMASGMGATYGQAAVAKLIMEAATKEGRQARKERKLDDLTCANCNVCFGEGGDGEKLLVCSRCKIVRYCGRDCQVRHWKEHKKECIKLASLNVGVQLGPPSEFDDGLSTATFSLRGGLANNGIRQTGGSGYKKPRGAKFDEKFVIKCQANSDMSPILIYDQSRMCNFYLRPDQKGFKQILQAVRNERAWEGRKTFMKASFDKNKVCTVYPEKAGVKKNYTW